MSRRNWALALGALTAAALLAACEPEAPRPEVENRVPPEVAQALLEGHLQPDFVPGEVIVKLKEEEPAPGAPFTGRLSTMGLQATERRTSGGELIIRIAGREAMAEGDLREQTLATVESLQADPTVEYAQPNYFQQILRAPDDSFYPLQWHYRDNGTGTGQSPGGIGLPAYWDTSVGSSSVVVAVLDTGILPNHTDIAGSPNLLDGFDMISDDFVGNDPDSGRDDDETDPGDAVRAGECGLGRPPRDRQDSWHGTHVAGTVGVVATDNAAGVAGVNWDVGVLPVRVLGKCGGLTSDINDAIRWAAGLPVPGVRPNTTPADVINLSLGGPGACSGSPSQQAAINDAVAQGVTVVVAAGNEAQNAANVTPASCNNTITVAASDYNGRLSSRYSNFGAVVDILAPGGDLAQDADNDGNPDGVLSTVDGGFAFYNGTSMAAPHVAGVAALLLSVDNSMGPADILAHLQATSLPRSAAQCPQACGSGLLQAVLPTGGARVTVTPASLDLGRGDTAVLDVTVTDNGNPQPGVNVTGTTADANIATVTSGVTNATGQTQLTVTAGQTSGNTTVTAEALGAKRDVPVKVPTLALWGLLAAVVAMILLLRRRARATVREPAR